jgi:hypothetical protein
MSRSAQASGPRCRLHSGVRRHFDILKARWNALVFVIVYPLRFSGLQSAINVRFRRAISRTR